MPESEPFSIPLDLSWAEDENGVLVVTGCASVPEEDKERESITKEAIEKALPDFMNFAILHLDHSERPLGPITEAWFEGSKFMIRALIKMTDDCQDVRDRIRSGELGQLSVFGRRILGTPSCRLHPNLRSETCKTLEMFMDSISLCPTGNAMNPDSYVEHNGGIVRKATSSESALMYETADGKEKKMDGEIDETPPTDSAPDGKELLDKILNVVSSLSDRLTAVEQQLQEMTSVEPEDIEKADEEEPDGDGATEEYPDDGYEGDDEGGEEEPDLREIVVAIAQGMAAMMQKLEDIEQRLPGGNADTGEENPDEIEKCGGDIKKAEPSDEIKKALSEIDALKAANAEYLKENEIIRKAIVELEKSGPRARKVVVDATIVGGSDEIKKAKTPEETPSGDSNPAALMVGQMRG